MPRLTKKITMWFDYPDDPDKGRIEITNLDEQDIAAIAEASIKNRTVYDFEAKKRVQEQSINTLADRQETVVRAVVNWENFFDADGQQLDCTDQAKRDWACNNDFMKFVNKCLAVVAKETKKATAAKIKN